MCQELSIKDTEDKLGNKKDKVFVILEARFTHTYILIHTTQNKSKRWRSYSDDNKCNDRYGKSSGGFYITVSKESSQI